MPRRFCYANRRWSSAMHDLLFLLLGLGGFAALFGYAVFCERN